MPRCSKRSRSAAPPGDLVPGATALDDHHHHKRSRNTSSRRHSKAEDSSFSVKKCIAWFKEYTTATEPDVLGPEGMEKFCEDLGVEPENVVMLVIAYKMAAKQMGFFTQEEWLKGLTELQCDTVHKLQSKLDHLRNTLNDPYIFKAIYRYSYDFARDKEQRSLETGTARALLGVLLPRWPLRAPLAAFLQQEPRYRVLNRDQWCNILEFSRTVGLDLAAYDPDGACRYSSASASAAPPARARLTSASFCRRARAARRVRGVAAGRARRRRAPRRPAHRTHRAPRQLRPPPARRPP